MLVRGTDSSKSKGVEIDILHWVSRSALEFIGQAGFGQSFDPLLPGADDGQAGAISNALKNIVSVLVSAENCVF